MTQGVGTPLLWIGFTVFVLGMLALDLGVFHRKAHSVGHREAFLWTVVWVSLAVAFNVWIFLGVDTQRGLEFLTGYLIFRYFSVPAESQHRALFWGILGALIMRALFILLGVALLESFHWVIYIFGAFLLYTGYKMLNGHDMEVHPERNPVVRLFQRAVPIATHYDGSRMLVRQRGRLMATPLLLVLAVIEGTDLVFAVDSIPAIFAVTRDPFIVYTSNIFAILGLRSLYFLLAGAMTKIQYLKVGLGAVLSFVGVKMLLSEFYTIPTLFSLGVIAGLLGAAMLASFLRPVGRAPIGRGDAADPLHAKKHHLEGSQKKETE